MFFLFTQFEIKEQKKQTEEQIDIVKEREEKRRQLIAEFLPPEKP